MLRQYSNISRGGGKFITLPLLQS